MEEVDLKQLVKDIGEIKKTVTSTDSKLDTLTEKINGIERENEELKKKVEQLTIQNITLSKNMNNLEQYSRKDNVIINGIPQMQNENVYEWVKLVADKLDVTLYEYDISTAHRLPARGDNIPPIVVRLNNRDKKSKLISSSRRIKLHGKDLNLNPAVPIFVGEHLTLQSMAILKKANELKRKGLIFNAWCIDGKIFIRVNDKDAAVRIDEESQLDNFEDDVSNASQESATSTPINGNNGQSSSEQDRRLRSGNKPLTLSQLNVAKTKSSKRAKSKNRN